jgi:hypothetical protein
MAENAGKYAGLDEQSQNGDAESLHTELLLRLMLCCIMNLLMMSSLREKIMD